MSRLWDASLAAVLFFSACSAHSKKPIEVDMPTTQKHFIVKGDVGHVVDASSAAPERRALPPEPTEAP
ncbi:MAG: hypothetical protein ACREJ9_13970 [Candidatus Rokuibacteriota bacterium]